MRRVLTAAERVVAWAVSWRDWWPLTLRSTVDELHVKLDAAVTQCVALSRECAAERDHAQVLRDILHLMDRMRPVLVVEDPTPAEEVAA